MSVSSPNGHAPQRGLRRGAQPQCGRSPAPELGPERGRLDCALTIYTVETVGFNERSFNFEQHRRGVHSPQYQWVSSTRSLRKSAKAPCRSLPALE
eukprot:1185427-Prorocentrum_minimum.AAC.1